MSAALWPASLSAAAAQVATTAVIPPPGDPDRALLERILADPELAGASEPGSALAAIIEALQALMGTLLGSEGAIGAAEVTRVVFFVFIGAVVIWLLRKLLQKLSPPPERASADPLSPIRLESPEHHETLAEEALREGALRPALRHTLLSALAALERSRWASYGRHKTNREYHRTIVDRGAPAELCTSVGALVGAFDPLWYGREKISRGEVETLRVLAGAARAAAASHPRPGRDSAPSELPEEEPA